MNLNSELDKEFLSPSGIRKFITVYETAHHLFL